MKKPNHITKNYEGLFDRAREGTASPRQAIKAMCQQCVGYQDTKRAIRECSSEMCPIWAYRPYSKNMKVASLEGLGDLESTNGTLNNTKAIV